MSKKALAGKTTEKGWTADRLALHLVVSANPRPLLNILAKGLTTTIHLDAEQAQIEVFTIHVDQIYMFMYM